jgi:hypothetical protein
MKVSPYINQHIGAEMFPGFPTSRRFRRIKGCVERFGGGQSQRCSPTFDETAYTFSHFWWATIRWKKARRARLTNA